MNWKFVIDVYIWVKHEKSSVGLDFVHQELLEEREHVIREEMSTRK